MTVDDWWQREGAWVEPPNERREGHSGVKRVQDPELGLLYVKLQTNHLYRSLRHPLGRPTVLRERDALLAVAALGIKVPEVVYAGEKKTPSGWQAVLVTRALAGHVDMYRWYKQGGRAQLGEEQHAALLHKLGQVLGHLHRCGWQHTNLYPNHIFIGPAGTDGMPDIALIDLENSRRVLWKKRAAQRDLDKLHKRCKMLSRADWQLLLNAHRQVLAA